MSRWKTERAQAWGQGGGKEGKVDGWMGWLKGVVRVGGFAGSSVMSPRWWATTLVKVRLLLPWTTSSKALVGG